MISFLLFVNNSGSPETYTSWHTPSRHVARPFSVTARIAELVGAQPVTIQQSELSQAMATGVVDAFLTSGSTGWDTKTYEYIKKFYDTQAWLPKNAVIV